MNEEAYKFFLMAVEDATLRTRYYNGEKNLLKQCSASESNRVRRDTLFRVIDWIRTYNIINQIHHVED